MVETENLCSMINLRLIWGLIAVLLVIDGTRCQQHFASSISAAASPRSESESEPESHADLHIKNDESNKYPKQISLQLSGQQTNGPFITDDIKGFPSLLDEKENLYNYTKLHNLTNLVNDSHVYYNSTFMVDENVAKSFWVDMDQQKNVTLNELLSNSHRRAATIKLKFDFPFYGHLVSKVTIATGGFLYTGDYVHSWLAATQYIAPLMANFDTSTSNHSFIKYVDNATSFTVQWENVTLQEKPYQGNFTFQASIFNDGKIVFVYKQIPYPVENITDDNHPVKVGISDAYINDKVIFFVRRKTIYEYHNVNFKQKKITNWTVIQLNPLQTCLDNKDCKSCFTNALQFKCYWCPSANRCSNGIDRYRQDWFDKNCTMHNVTTLAQCPANSMTASDSSQIDASTVHNWVNHNANSHSSSQKIISNDKDQSNQYHNSFALSLLSLFGIVGSAVLWIVYAYLKPHSASGQFLIRYRPSQWSLKRGEARYTAASIHI